jgi:hypothetical protein
MREVISIFLILFANVCTAQTGSKLMFKSYLLNIHSYNCNFEFFINNVLVQSDYNNNNLSFELAVNQWLRKGENNIKVKVSPLKGESFLNVKARVEVQINLIENKKDYSASQRIPVLHFNTRDSAQSEIENFPFFETTKYFYITDEFELPWENKLPFTLDSANTKSILLYYTQIYSLFEKKNIDSIMTLFNEKNVSYAKALNETQSEFLVDVREGFEEIFADVDNELWPLDKQKLLPRYFAGNKLVGLYNELNQPCILFYNQKNNVCTFIDIFIMNDENLKFKVIR